MKIIYLTTALTTPDFASLNQRLRLKANPSNQNFHHRLLLSFSQHHETTAVCYRPLPGYGHPFAWARESKTDQGIAYHYLPIINLPFLKQHLVIVSGSRLIRQMINNNRDEKPLVVVDAMNATLRKLAQRLRRRHGLKAVAVVTDHPALLSGVSPAWARSCLKGMRRFDAFITLTPALSALANPNRRPSVVLPGVIDEFVAPKKETIPYIFFAGALHSRYGISHLLEAFSKLNAAVGLSIAGHGPEDEVRAAAQGDHRIRYLGQLPPDAIREMECGALFNVNPRPSDETLDAYSIPSKFFEYLSSGSLTVSSRHPCLTKLFQEDVLWAGNGSVADLLEAMKTALALSEEAKRKMALTAKETVLSQFGIAAVGEFLVHFTNSLK
ncbi:MAG: glycosyltransferase [Bacilli bacterium]|jgi:glycosyltransferase involved in cell wall biosynthesis